MNEKELQAMKDREEENRLAKITAVAHGYDVFRSDLHGYYWQKDEETSEDYHSMGAAWRACVKDNKLSKMNPPERYVSLDTVQVDITPACAIAVMNAIDKRGEPWQLMRTASMSSFMALETWIDGSEGLLKIRLNGDGTWTALTDVVIGEKA